MLNSRKDIDQCTLDNISKLKQILPVDTTVISNEMAEKLKKELNVDDFLELGRLLCFAFSLERTVSPISSFAAGAISIGVSGNMYVGFNIEYLRTPLGETIHAEQCSIANAICNGESYVTHIITAPTPCGHCRQFIRECKNAEQIVVHSCSKEKGEFLFHTPLLELLPYSFGPLDLGCERGIFDSNDKVFNISKLQISESDNDVKELGMEIIKRSHSPHTKSWCSVVIVWEQQGNRKLSGGVYLENAAYNPSLGALQCAFVSLLTSGGQFEDIKSVFVFEDETALVRHLDKTQLVLRQTAPNVQVTLQPISSS